MGVEGIDYGNFRWKLRLQLDCAHRGFAVIQRVAHRAFGIGKKQLVHAGAVCTITVPDNEDGMKSNFS